MKKIFVLLLAVCFSFGVNSQRLEVEGIAPNLYLSHTVAPQETFYSIGRLYNVAPRTLAAYNQLQLDKGLNIDQRIKIPLDKNNFSQSEVKSVLDYYLPLFHTVKQGETLYRVSVNYNKVPLQTLKQWNNMVSETVSSGMQMIVGYLKVDKNQSAFAQRAPKESDASTVAQSEEIANAQDTRNNRVEETATRDEAQANAMPAAPAARGGKEGYFKSYYLPSSFNQKSGKAAAFKSTSGWQDEKYYCFVNEAAPGSIVKVTDDASGSTIYARVLDAIPDIKQNNGLLIILSNAAVDALGRGEEQFDCTVSYQK